MLVLERDLVRSAGSVSGFGTWSVFRRWVQPSAQDRCRARALDMPPLLEPGTSVRFSQRTLHRLYFLAPALRTPRIGADLERLKWLLWHGNTVRADQMLSWLEDDLYVDDEAGRPADRAAQAGEVPR